MNDSDSDEKPVQIPIRFPKRQPPPILRSPLPQPIPSHLRSPLPQRESKEWSFCCSKTSPRAVKYFTTLGISVIVLLFSIIQISLGNESPIYFNLLSLIIGIYIKTPQMKEIK